MDRIKIDPREDSEFRVIAIIAAFNEGDIISQVIGHLVQNGIDVYLIDNHSTDDTVKRASAWQGKGLVHIERFPESDEDAKSFDWTGILRRKEQLVRELKADWFIHYDADEIREGPWPGLELKDAIRWVDTLGYNCIGFRVLNFVPVDKEFSPGDNLKDCFQYYEEAQDFDKMRLNCWKPDDGPFDLASSGGHEVLFERRLVFPIKFLLRHYPIRSQEHGRKKVFQERKGRFDLSERAKGWHRQYDEIDSDAYCFLGDPGKLHEFCLDRIRLELQLPDVLRAEFANLEETAHHVKLHAKNLEEELDHLRPHAATLEKERDGLKAHASNLETERLGLQHHSRNLERVVTDLKRQLADLSRRLRVFEEQDKSHDLTAIWNSIFRRSVGALRRISKFLKSQ